jgi:hypothetical protein
MMKNEKNFTESVNLQKSDRLARESLRELMYFGEALDNEISRMQASESASDPQMLHYMTASKAYFNDAMQAMRHSSGEAGRLALIKFADSVQDLMGYIHKMRLH